MTVQGEEVVVTLGRVAMAGQQTVAIPVRVSGNANKHGRLSAVAVVESSTALPVWSNAAASTVAP
jgi:hypothetical protein